MTDSKNITEKLSAELIDSQNNEQFLQRINQTKWNLIMRRNFEEDLLFFNTVILQMKIRIVKCLLTIPPQKTLGFELMWKECEEWIKLICETRDGQTQNDSQMR